MSEPEDDPFDELDDLDHESEESLEAFDELFVEGTDDDLDDEAVWAALADGEPGTLDEADAELDAIVPKRTYCERCEHLSTPPSVSCEHPDTGILELVDREHFRVRNCPVVERRHGTDR